MFNLPANDDCSLLGCTFHSCALASNCK